MAFTFIRNEYQLTPLEGIELSVGGAKLELALEEANFFTLIDEAAKEISLKKLHDLETTISVLEEEAVFRKAKVERLYARRAKLVDCVANIRQFGFQIELEDVFKKIQRIDVELGPYHWLDRRFNLG